MEGGGFEPPKSTTADLQSAPFGRSGTPPGEAFRLLFKWAYRPVAHWSWRQELNPQPADYKSAALPIELRQHKMCLIYQCPGKSKGINRKKIGRELFLDLSDYFCYISSVTETRYLGCSSTLLGAPHFFVVVTQKHPSAALPSVSSLRRTFRYASLLNVQAPGTRALLINLQRKGGCIGSHF